MTLVVEEKLLLELECELLEVGVEGEEWLLRCVVAKDFSEAVWEGRLSVDILWQVSGEWRVAGGDGGDGVAVGGLGDDDCLEIGLSRGRG